MLKKAVLVLFVVISATAVYAADLQLYVPQDQKVISVKPERNSGVLSAWVTTRPRVPSDSHETFRVDEYVNYSGTFMYPSGDAIVVTECDNILCGTGYTKSTK